MRTVKDEISRLGNLKFLFVCPETGGGYIEGLRPMLPCVTLCAIITCPKSLKILALKRLRRHVLKLSYCQGLFVNSQILTEARQAEPFSEIGQVTSCLTPFLRNIFLRRIWNVKEKIIYNTLWWHGTFHCFWIGQGHSVKEGDVCLLNVYFYWQAH